MIYCVNISKKLREIKMIDLNELIDKNLIVKHVSGSQAYGTNTPESDLDIRGLFLADPINIRTPFFTIREHTIETEVDTKLYELTHFMKLCLDNNPNIIETLWIEESDILFKDSFGVYDYIRSNRQHFLSTKVAHTYSGYAYAQISRHKSHDKQQHKLEELQELYKNVKTMYDSNEITIEEIGFEFGEQFKKYFCSRL